ncbi:MAG: hypothetical protein IJJ33_06590 [Victivallales bacterium]|nr:hypothetical protein [Victivallales bacterium]
MEHKPLIILMIALDVVLAGATAYFYVDANSQANLAKSLGEERDAALAKLTELEDAHKTLTARLNAAQQGNEAPTDADAARLRQAIDEKDAEISRLKANANRTAPSREREHGNRNRGGGPGNFRENMERLKTENPELYARIEERRKKMEERTLRRDQYLNNIDTSRLNATQRQTVSDYQALLKANEELRQSMENGESDNESRREMFDNMRQIGQMSGEIRSILLEQYANTLSSGNGAAVAEEIQNIIDATSAGPGGGPGGPGGFGGPGRRGPGGF